MTPTLLHVGDYWEFGTALLRRNALQRLGFVVHDLDVQDYLRPAGRLGTWVRLRCLRDRSIDRLNHALIERARELRPTFIWFDKPLFIRPETVDRLNELGALTINYVIDNPFHLLPREAGWRLLRRAIRHYGLNVVPRPSSIAEYQAAGAGQVVLAPLSFDAERDIPPPAFSDCPGRDVSFIGAPYGNRPQFLKDLAASGVRIHVSGQCWDRHAAVFGPNLTLGPARFGADYARTVWNSRINLGFVTHGHNEPWAHRAFELTAAQGFLLAERISGHQECFAEGTEAEFFSCLDEARDKAHFYLAHDQARRALARAGCLRSWRSGYSNDERLARVFLAVDPTLGGSLMTRAASYMAHRRRVLGLD